MVVVDTKLLLQLQLKVFKSAQKSLWDVVYRALAYNDKCC